MNDIAGVNGRIKNILDRSDIALSPVGNILINSYTMVLVDLYAFSEKLPEPFRRDLLSLLESKEGMPELVIRLSTPKEKPMSLYDEVMKARANPQFKSAQEGLDFYLEEYEALGAEYGLTGDEFWMQAEESELLNEDHKRIMRLQRGIQMFRHLIKKEENGE